MSQIAQRLERLPFDRFHYKLLLMGGLGYMFEAVDAAIIAFLVPVLRPLWGLTSVETGILASSTFFGFLVGALTAGALGDRYGRRNVMMWALMLFCAAAFASAFVNNWHHFFALRVIGGIGMGAEAAIIAPFLSEFVSANRRGSFTASLAGFFSFGFVTAALMGYFIVPLGENGWRYAVVATALPVVLVLWWRRSVYESPRWLESRGRHAEAEAVVASIEADFEKRGIKLPPVPATGAIATSPAAGFGETFKALWSPKLRRITVMTWLLWISVTFCSYLFFTWIPGLLVERGMTITKSFSFSIVIYLAQIPGYFSAAWACERIGRQYTIVSYMAGAALSAIGLATVQTDQQVLVMSVLLSFFINGVNAGEFAYTPEVFPTRVRATGVGTASAIGRIGAISSPILVGYIYPIAGFPGVFGMTTAVLLAGALSVLILGIPTRGRSLEEIESTEFQTALVPVEGAEESRA
ncbi:putative MFS transporter [Bradyrhizobium sp. USDA 4449]